jgi:hypothetical protein
MEAWLGQKIALYRGAVRLEAWLHPRRETQGVKVGDMGDVGE